MNINNKNKVIILKHYNFSIVKVVIFDKIINQTHKEMKKINRSAIMKYAWKLFKSQDVRTDEMFSICLKQGWLVSKSQPDFNNIYKEYYSMIYYYILNMVKNKEVSQELTNDVFIKLTQNLYNSEQSKITTWLHGIAKNIVIDYCRKEKLDKHINMSNIVDADENEVYQFVDKSYKTESMVENSELRSGINHAFDNLTTKYKRVAELFFIEDKPYDEIAILCEIPLGSVKGMIFRVRKLLQLDLKYEYKNV